MSLTTRIAKLEQQHPPAVASPYEFPVLPESWFEEFWTFVAESPHLEAILRVLGTFETES